jgi:hypothetical protein
MKNTWIIGATALGALFFMGCSGEEKEEGEICTNLQVNVTVTLSSGQPATAATVKLDGAECTGDGTGVYVCTAIQDALATYQLSVLEGNSDAFSQFLALPAPEDWCASSPFPVDVLLDGMMGA